MRTKVGFLSLLIALTGLGSMQAYAQQEEDVRGAFLTTRPKPSASATKPGPNSRPSRRRPKASTSNATTNNAAPTSGSAKTESTPRKASPQRMGLGLTLFMRDSNGLAVRADPSRTFRKGDHVRVLVETNADGYLYVFNTTDGGQPVMIYPDAELEEAGNFIQGHVPWEIPSSAAAEERLRWFTFDQNSGTEKLYFVFTREPLTAVPIEDDLITYCRENDGKCPWHPAADVWAQIKKELDEPVKTAKVESFGNSQSAPERQAATRGIGLNRDDPEPSLIMLTASTNKNILVATLELIHKSEIGTAETNKQELE
ncbi:MAG: DUF4384 domain-containing protein [Acidobacteriota bacterium]|nr:DUF4384 domain-containing protein [Acidobacteriota bacterium]